MAWYKTHSTPKWYKVVRRNYWTHDSLSILVTKLLSSGVCGWWSVGAKVVCFLKKKNCWFCLSGTIHGLEYKLHAQLGSPRKVNIDRGPGRPEYLVDSAYLFKADLGLPTKNIVIVDHSESFFIKSPPLQEVQPTIYYAAPEVLFGSSPDFCSDVWAIVCLIYDMRSGTPLLYLAIQNRPFFAVYQIILVLGQLPPCWNLELGLQFQLRVTNTMYRQIDH